MNSSLTAHLRCPICLKTDWVLEAETREDQRIIAGRLLCRGCGRAFSIARGIANLVHPELLTDSQREEREALAARPPDPAARRLPAEQSDFLFRTLEYDSPEDRRVLLIGAAPETAGRFAELGFEVIALDFIPSGLEALAAGPPPHVGYDYAFEQISGLPSNLPFIDGLADIVFCQGALARAVPRRVENFRPFDPANMLEALREVRRVLKSEGLFFVRGEKEAPEELDDLERAEGGGEALYKRTEYERAFDAAGIGPNLWIDSDDCKLTLASYLTGHRRLILTTGDAVTPWSELLARAPALRADLDLCLAGWTRVRPWPAAPLIAPKGGPVPADHAAAFARGWHVPEFDRGQAYRWIGREAAGVAFELDYKPGAWVLEMSVRACSLLGEFESAVFILAGERLMAREIVPLHPDPRLRLDAFSFEAELEAGPACIGCIPNGRMRLSVFFNGVMLTVLEPPSDNAFHTYRIGLPGESTRALNQLTLEPSYALQPSLCAAINDSRHLSCAVRGIWIERPSSQ